MVIVGIFLKKQIVFWLLIALFLPVLNFIYMESYSFLKNFYNP